MSGGGAPDDGADADAEKYRYKKHTWPEIDRAAADGNVILAPVGSTEDHGHHLPLDVDQVLPTSICEEVAKRRDDAILFPTTPQGYLPHHMDFPGGITLRWDTFVNYFIDVGVSLAHHGFEKILFVNGHGSNHHLIEQASRQVNIQYPNVRCAMISWWEIQELRDVAPTLREGGPGSAGHAGELETSLYLYLDPGSVDAERVREDRYYPDSPNFNNVDLLSDRRDEDHTAVTMMEWWSTISETGVMGDPTDASAETGERIFEAAVDGLDAIVEAFADYPIRDVDDKHHRDVSDDEYDPFRPR